MVVLDCTGLWDCFFIFKIYKMKYLLALVLLVSCKDEKMVNPYYSKASVFCNRMGDYVVKTELGNSLEVHRIYINGAYYKFDSTNHNYTLIGDSYWDTSLVTLNAATIYSNREEALKLAKLWNIGIESRRLNAIENNRLAHKLDSIEKVRMDFKPCN